MNINSKTNSRTIAAIATAQGNAAIGIIRISGSKSFSIINQIFTPKNNKKSFIKQYSRQILGNIIIDDKIVDESIVILQKSPNSYNGEDIVEIYAHGGYILLNLILNYILKLGAKLAEPGEFTKIALLNNKIDLLKVEAINDIINAPTLKHAHLSNQQLSGKLSKLISELFSNLKNIISQLNASIDFSDEDINPQGKLEIKNQIKDLIKKINNCLSNANQSIAMHHGYKIAIIGAPNVGKSCLLNKLLGDNRSLVSEMPGTTRDYVLGYITFNGFKIEIVDTAGIRSTDEIVEKMGIKLSIKQATSANLILVVYDQTNWKEIDLTNLKDVPIIKIANKCDLPIKKEFISGEIIKFSALTGLGKDRLYSKIKEKLMDNNSLPIENALIFNNRQKQLLTNCLKSLKKSYKMLEINETEEIITFEIETAITQLAILTGKITTEEILDQIFSQFCIGK